MLGFRRESLSLESRVGGLEKLTRAFAGWNSPRNLLPGAAWSLIRGAFLLVICARASEQGSTS